MAGVGGPLPTSLVEYSPNSCSTTSWIECERRPILRIDGNRWASLFKDFDGEFLAQSCDKTILLLSGYYSGDGCAAFDNEVDLFLWCLSYHASAGVLSAFVGHHSHFSDGLVNYIYKRGWDFHWGNSNNNNTTTPIKILHAICFTSNGFFCSGLNCCLAKSKIP